MPRKELSAEERRLVDAAAEKTFILYEGRLTPHRSCGIALAETFGVPWRPYQSLRRGGVTGAGECGAIKAGELILGEFFGDAAPTGAVTPVLREALVEYQRRVKERVSKGASPDYTCNNPDGAARRIHWRRPHGLLHAARGRGGAHGGRSHTRVRRLVLRHAD